MFCAGHVLPPHQRHPGARSPQVHQLCGGQPHGGEDHGLWLQQLPQPRQRYNLSWLTEVLVIPHLSYTLLSSSSCQTCGRLRSICGKTARLRRETSTALASSLRRLFSERAPSTPRAAPTEQVQHTLTQPLAPKANGQNYQGH